MVACGRLEKTPFNAPINFVVFSSSIAINKPGFVQNCPAPRFTELPICTAKSSYSFFIFSGKKKIGFTLPISANTGIGSAR